VGLANTLGGLLFVAPLIAGWLAQAFGYEVLFVAVLAMALLGILTALRGMDLFVALSGAAVPEPALAAPDNPEAGLDG
jgi:dipeptide/tripeptide permease